MFPIVWQAKTFWFIRSAVLCQFYCLLIMNTEYIQFGFVVSINCCRRLCVECIPLLLFMVKTMWIKSKRYTIYGIFFLNLIHRDKIKLDSVRMSHIIQFHRQSWFISNPIQSINRIKTEDKCNNFEKWLSANENPDMWMSYFWIIELESWAAMTDFDWIYRKNHQKSERRDQI